MKSHDFFIKEEEDGKTFHIVELYKAPTKTELLYQFWHWIDPCCRKPQWLWSRFAKYYFNSVAHREKFLNATIQVSREWAITHYDWDIKEYEKDVDDG